MASATLSDWINLKRDDDDINYFEYNEFINMEKVGEGGFATVSKAYWKSGRITLALKTLLNKPINEQNANDRNKFLKEVRIEYYTLNYLLCNSFE